MDVPFGLDRERNLERESHSVWARRAGLVVILTFIVLGLLNLFGQRSTVSTVTANGVALTLDSPTALRSGLLFTTEISVTSQTPVKDLHVVVSSDWLRGMTLNGIAPQASNDNGSDRGLDLDYQQLDAGKPFVMWISWQVNPTTVGSRSQDVTIDDGSKELVTMHRATFIFP